jgi:hypothetical protein
VIENWDVTQTGKLSWFCMLREKTLGPTPEHWSQNFISPDRLPHACLKIYFLISGIVVFLF